MDALTYSTRDLLKIIEKNREIHCEEFQAANAAFRDKLITAAYSLADAARGDKPVSLIIDLPQPKSHQADYDAVLTMLGMTVEETVQLEEHDFRRYVMDEWAWSQDFKSVVSGYCAR